MRNYLPTPTDYKHLRLVMTLIALCCQAVQTGELGHTNGQTDGRTLPSTLSLRFAVDNK